MKLRDLQEAKYADSGTHRLHGTLVAGLNRQHHEPITIVVGKCGEVEDWGVTKSKPCYLIDFEGGPIAAQYLKRNTTVGFQSLAVDFGQDESWYVSPVGESDWEILENPGYKEPPAMISRSRR